MAEYLNNIEKQRVERLYDFCQFLINGENGKLLIQKYQTDIDNLSPFEVMITLDKLLQSGFTSDQVKSNMGKIINVFTKSLSKYFWGKPGADHFLSHLMLENREVEKIMTEIKSINKILFQKPENNTTELRLQLQEKLKSLQEYELHYIKKENILFPYLEKIFEGYRCLQIMWSFHDDFRKSLKTLDSLLNEEIVSLDILNKELGKLFFVVIPIIFREEHIVFPVAYKAIPENYWNEMLQQSFEIGFSYIHITKSEQNISKNIPINSLHGIDLLTGIMSADQIRWMLNTLPIDITYLNDQDEVCYFSGSSERIFPRSKAIIGRKVQNCHPPESVHIVNEIIDSFRTGKKNHADFWIQMRGKFINIRYIAVRDEQGIYKGTIEVSQDISDIKNLQGEKRLLNWE